MIFSYSAPLLAASTRLPLPSAPALALPYDHMLRQNVYEIVHNKKKLNPKIFLLIGIGGSNMGTLAIHQALFGTLFNEGNPETYFYCIDTIDDLLLAQTVHLVEKVLAQGAHILCNIVSKSGTTLETIANATFFIELIKKYHPDNYHEQIVITTDEGSALYQHAQQEDYTILTIPHNVGGRYSALSAVGLFPLAFLGVSIEKLHEGARNLTENASASASILYNFYRQGINIHDTFLFSPKFYYLGAWYRQLMAESLGKNNQGMTPTISIGSTDLHSATQLYLSGPRDRITTFVTQHTVPSTLHIPATPISELHPNLTHKSITHIQQALYEGTKTAYSLHNRPYMEIIFEGDLTYDLGQFMQFKMQEIILLGQFLNIDPFDQPAVEIYKKETKKLLASL